MSLGSHDGMWTYDSLIKLKAKRLFSPGCSKKIRSRMPQDERFRVLPYVRTLLTHRMPAMTKRALTRGRACHGPLSLGGHAMHAVFWSGHGLSTLQRGS